MVLFRERYELLQKETLGLRSRDPNTSLEVQRNIDELWRQVAALRELGDVNADTINQILKSDVDPSGEPGGSGGSAPGAGPDGGGGVAYEWQQYNLVFDPSAGTNGYTNATTCQTRAFNLPYTTRFKSITVKIEWQSKSNGSGGVFMLVANSDVLSSVWNKSTNPWVSGESVQINGAAIEGGGTLRQFAPTTNVFFRFNEGASSAKRITVQALVEMRIPVAQV